MNEIFNCEINTLMERFFDAPDKKPASKKSEESENEDETKPGLSDKDSDEKVITISIKLTRFIIIITLARG